MIDALHPCTITIAAETPDQSEVAALLHAADARSASLYPAESRHGSSIVTLLAQDVSFFVVRRGGEKRSAAAASSRTARPREN